MSSEKKDAITFGWSFQSEARAISTESKFPHTRGWTWKSTSTEAETHDPWVIDQSHTNSGEPEQRAATLWRWAKPSIEFGTHQIRFGVSLLGGVGAFAISPIRAGAIVIALPRSMMISLQMCYSGWRDLERFNVPEYTAFALFVMHQRLLGDKARYSGYVQTLPPRGTASWSSLNMTEEYIAALPSDYAKECRAARGRSCAARSCMDKFCDELEATGVPEDALVHYRDPAFRLWGCAMVNSRAVQVMGKTTLLPVVDSFNNADDGCELEYTASGGILLRAKKSYNTDEEIFLAIGKRSDQELFANYGYSRVLPKDQWIDRNNTLASWHSQIERVR